MNVLLVLWHLAPWLTFAAAVLYALCRAERGHSVVAHVVAPLWVRVPEKRRWRIVHRLDKSRERCWSDLVDAALTHSESDACDIKTPLGCAADRCKSVCDWGHLDHAGEHDCSCYCGKFQFRTPEGSRDRDGAR
jgi:hypothetical protein